MKSEWHEKLKKMSTKASCLEIPDLANPATASHTWLTELLIASTLFFLLRCLLLQCNSRPTTPHNQKKNKKTYKPGWNN